MVLTAAAEVFAADKLKTWFLFVGKIPTDDWFHF